MKRVKGRWPAGEGEKKRERGKERESDRTIVLVRFEPHWTSVFFCKLLLNGTSYASKIGCIKFL